MRHNHTVWNSFKYFLKFYETIAYYLKLKGNSQHKQITSNSEFLELSSMDFQITTVTHLRKKVRVKFYSKIRTFQIKKK